jgi:hypothetical protein
MLNGVAPANVRETYADATEKAVSPMKAHLNAKYLKTF